MTRYTVNGSILLTDLPLLERPGAVQAAGFSAVEFWWPFSEAEPTDAEVDRFVAAVSDAGVTLTGLNFFAGDMPAGDRGLVSWKSRQAEFLANLPVVTAIGERLGCRAFNALYGLRNDECSPDEAGALALDNLTEAATAVARIGGTVLLEPVSGAEGYPLRTAADALAVIDALRERGVDNVKLLADFYHLTVNGDDVDAVIREHAAEFGHIQIADAPGRGEPGSGTAPLSRWIADAEAGGYDGWVGLEYKTSAADPFAWLPREQRSA
ncbi:MAG TPA: TIM barrel protein [Microlunatus sp.]|nr:TIM barrel protein [Microlunatus sp.]